MRLNFSGVDEDDIREGVRRIGKVVREQVRCTRRSPGAEPPGRAAPRRRRRPARAQGASCRCGGRRDEPRRRPEGRAARSSGRSR
jgi:2-aminoadipate transaminase